MTTVTMNGNPSQISSARPWRATLGRIVAAPALWRRRAKERRDLMAMDARALRDIGISKLDVWREVNKPLWRA